jgi:hypothetical protein
MVRYGTIDSHQIKTYQLSLYRNGEDKIMTISDSVGNVAFYRADEYLGARQLTDTLVVYYQGVRLSPTEGEVTIVLLVKDDAYLEIIIKQEDGLIMFVIDPAILPTTKSTP